MSSPKSQLQKRILVALHGRRMESVVAVARTLKEQRPSVSRAVKALADSELIARKGRQLVLTPAGTAYAETIIAAAPRNEERTKRLIAQQVENQAKWHHVLGDPLTRQADVLQALNDRPDLRSILNQGRADMGLLYGADQKNPAARDVLNKALAEWRIGADVLADHRREMMAIPDVLNIATRDFRGILDQLPSGIGLSNAAYQNSLATHEAVNKALAERHTLVDVLADQRRESLAIQEALKAASHVQGLHTDWMLDIARPTLPPNIERLIGESSVVATQIVADLSAIKSYILPELPAWVGQVQHETAAFAHAYEAFESTSFHALEEMAERHTFRERTPSLPRLTRDVVLPTTTTASLVRSVRELVLADESVGAVAFGQDESTPAYHERQIEVVLRRLGTWYVRKWQGAGSVLRDTTNPDAVSQAAASGRELLDHVLKRLVPLNTFTEDEKELARKNHVSLRDLQIERIIGPQNQDALAFAVAIVRGHGLLNNLVHSEQDPPRFTPGVVSGMLDAFGGLITMLVEYYLEAGGQLR
jgi:DNA-binding MarR family transcriptional regulator